MRPHAIAVVRSVEISQSDLMGWSCFVSPASVRTRLLFLCLASSIAGYCCRLCPRNDEGKARYVPFWQQSLISNGLDAFNYHRIWEHVLVWETYRYGSLITMGQSLVCNTCCDGTHQHGILICLKSAPLARSVGILPLWDKGRFRTLERKSVMLCFNSST